MTEPTEIKLTDEDIETVVLGTGARALERDPDTQDADDVDDTDTDDADETDADDDATDEGGDTDATDTA
jgi:hypothetical protein